MSPLAANETAPDQLVEVSFAIVLRMPCCLSVRSANCGSMIVSGRETMRCQGRVQLRMLLLVRPCRIAVDEELLVLRLQRVEALGRVLEQTHPERVVDCLGSVSLLSLDLCHPVPPYGPTTATETEGFDSSGHGLS